MRISDWSSDVCSSDLSYVLIPGAYRSLSRPSSPLRAKASSVCPFLLSSPRTLLLVYGDAFRGTVPLGPSPCGNRLRRTAPPTVVFSSIFFFQYVKERSERSPSVNAAFQAAEIGRASGRERVCQYV